MVRLTALGILANRIGIAVQACLLKQPGLDCRVNVANSTPSLQKSTNNLRDERGRAVSKFCPFRTFCFFVALIEKTFQSNPPHMVEL